MASPFQRNENTVQLFLSTEPQKLYYKGPCAVDIKVLSQLFIVEPYDKDTNAVEISVYSPFNQYKNILCHISTQNNIALVFPTVEACKTVYDIIFKYQVDVKQEVDDLLSDHQLQNLILIPLFNEAKSNSLIHERTKHCIIDMLQDLASAAAEEILRNTNMKSELNEPLPFESQPSSKESSPTLCDTLASIVNQPLDRFQQNISVKDEPEEAVHVESDDLKLNVERLEPVENLQNESRKRRLSSENLNTVVQNKQCKIEVMDEQANLTPLQPQTSQGTLMATKKIIKSTHFVVHRITNYGYRKHELILFISDEKNLCYPYFYKKKNTGNCFTCINCLKSKSSVVAHLRCSESGEYFLELGLIKHVCAPENYNDRHYLYIEPCTSYSSLFFETQITKKKKPASLQTKSHSFAQLSKFNAISAESSQASSHNIRVETSQTLPNVTVTEESDIGAPKKILQSPDFELQIIKNYYGVKKYQLITFIAPDHELCYIYYQEYPNMRFQCKKCQNLRPNITAYLREGDDGKKYVFFNEHEHHCKPILYSSLTPKSDILEDSEYCISYSREGNIRPIVFDSIDRNLCYIFSHQKYNRFICDECESKDSPATLLKSKETNGEYFWKWKSSVHSCEPKILSTEEQEKVLMSAQFKFFNDNNDASNDLKLITFPYNDENVKSHIYIYSNVLDTFCCIKCLESDHLVIADVYLNSLREEYILESNPTKHICEPSVYSNLNLKNIVFKETSGLEVKKFYEKNWEEKNMLQAGNFKFQRNRDGVLNALLIIFTNEEKDCCYKYYYDGFAGLYYCHQCKVSAKTFVDENDKCFVRLSLAKHRCQPILYESEKKIVRKPDFLVLDDTKPQRLIVFTSSSRRKCYVYSGARFRCNKCVKFALTIDATLFNDENDERCVLLGRREHQCKPLKFENVAKKYNINC
uniref:Uncharacterized protein n=1 Tax=Panagrolaimus superbus TaxID=310955 RepID=A0A914YTB9_9BILA